ncbi:MAG TPA: peptide ABC transporter substrate-binding protein [Gammaproteobacteria bacterium]|nr:peptide ABC transporter substrate-binding protein [Gammaproteobacteria bacterium]
MNYLPKSLAVGFVLASFASASVLAAIHPVTGETLAEDQTFTYSLLDEFTSADPQIVEDVSGSAFARDLFEGLMNQDADGNLIPGVATGFTTNDAKDVYTFTLRDNAMWSDGNPVTAHDFVYAWRRLADPATASPYSWFAEIMALENVGAVLSGEASPDALGVTALDNHTLEVRLTASLPYFAAMTTHASTFPTPQWRVRTFGSDWTKPGNIVSNGAYVLTEHIPNERAVRERNTMYWNNDATILDKVVTLVINDENVDLTRYLAGELDKGTVPSGQYLRLKEEYPNQATSFPRLCTYYYTFNLSPSGQEAYQDVRVRQALSYAVDRSVVTEKILQAGQIQAFTFTPGATAGFEVPPVAFGQMSQDERNAKAQELMAEAGYGSDNPLSIELMYNTSEGHKKIAIAVQQMWKETLGVNTTLANQEWKTFLKTRGSQNFDVARGGWCGDYNEASTFLDLLTTPSGYNDGKFSNAEVDELMLEARTLSDATANYTRVEEILANEMPVIPVYHYSGVFMLKTNVKGWPYDNVEQNWYSRDLYKVAQ